MFHCNLCGAVSRADTQVGHDAFDGLNWLNNVRAIFIDGLDYLNPELSGVSYSNASSNRILVPREHNSGPQHRDPEMVVLHWAIPTLLPDGTLHPDSAVTGYIVHENCWKLLAWTLYPQKVNIKTLNLFFRSFGIMPECQVVNWGHTYGGLFASNDDDNMSIHPRHDGSHPNGTRIWEGNPIIIENDRIRNQLTGRGLKKLLGQSKSTGQRTVSGFTHSSVRTGAQDCFDCLPAELIEHIMKLLLSADVLNVKLASRAFAGVAHTKAFWHSRFWAGQEFEYVFEPWLQKAGVIKDLQFAEPRIVYEVLKNESGSLALANRRRIYELLRPIAAGLHSFASHQKRFGTTEPSGRALASLWQPELEDEDTARWECAYGELLDSELQPYHFGCRPLFKRLLALSESIVAVKVSVLPFHNGISYVTGLRFCLADASEETIGYILAGNEVTLETGGLLRGFRVVTSDRGIHALSILNKDGLYSTSAGSASGLRERKIGWGSRIQKVKAYFDVS
jgi:hypothetical protein